MSGRAEGAGKAPACLGPAGDQGPQAVTFRKVSLLSCHSGGPRCQREATAHLQRSEAPGGSASRATGGGSSDRPHRAAHSNNPAACLAAIENLLMPLTTPPTEHFDVIVVGGGHAGCEAAITAARLGCSTALFSLNLDRIAWQPCNPAVGGPAKSQLVHEVDALGGVIGRLADATALQKRVLNASRGPAVWALRAQTDKRQYARQMLQLLQHTPNLALREAMVTGLVVDDDSVRGVSTYFGSTYSAGAVILTAGTFLGGQIWVGNQSMSAGRAGEQAAEGLTEALEALGFQMGRLKTGTPARVDRRSIALDQLEEQPSDAHGRYFSFDPASWVSGEPMSCHITRTTAATHQLIRDNLHLTPISGGFIYSNGPRYCPTIEDKIVRFADK